MDDIKNIIIDFLKHRPEVLGAYGYGSGVFTQINKKLNQDTQIDIILVVEDMKQWHQQNMQMNPQDYKRSAAKYLSNYEKKENDLGSEITYLPFLKDANHTFKIGVISNKSFIRELEYWESYFIAGRFQKPINFIKSNLNFDNRIAKNRKKALIIVLWKLYKEKSKEHTITELFEEICELSFMGDTRMLFVENPHKVKNTVQGCFNEFKLMYTDDELYTLNEDETININRHNLFLSLLEYFDLDNFFEVSNKDIDNKFIKKNFTDSVIQTYKGLRTIGSADSVKYVIQKVKKRIYQK